VTDREHAALIPRAYTREATSPARDVKPTSRRRSLRRILPVAGLLSLLAPLSTALAEEPTVLVSMPEGGYVGEAVCLDCHEDQVGEFRKTRHAHVLNEKNGRSALMKHGCESCHGPGAAHVKDEGAGAELITFSNATPELIEEGKAQCLACHERGNHLHWKGSPHDSRDLSCTSCHTLMKNVSTRNQLSRPTEMELCGSCHPVRRSQMFRNAHMPVREGAMTCSSCHASHGSVTTALLSHDTVNDNCYSCHAEKRGPFLWEHAPVNENCLDCHDAHGSTRAAMLRLDPPRLCQQCHIEVLHPTEARLPNNRFVIGRSCMQCHPNVHGSNHPSGFGLTR
jgi:DmsE family decaheme c-type cytochrome